VRYCVNYRCVCVCVCARALAYDIVSVRVIIVRLTSLHLHAGFSQSFPPTFALRNYVVKLSVCLFHNTPPET